MPPAEARQLLAEANRLRSRGQHDEAISVCTRILRADANHAGAHSLLGDIYRDTGNYREALGWFKLAVQLNPNNRADRKKLDEMIDHVFQGAMSGASGRVPHLEVAPPAPAKREQRGLRSALRWALTRLQPMHVVVGSTVLAVVAMLAIALISGRGPAPSRHGRPSPPSVAGPAEATTQRDRSGISVSPAPGTGTRVTPPPPDAVESGQNGPSPDPAALLGATPAPRASPPVSSAPSAVHEVPPFQPAPSVRPMTLEEAARKTEQVRAAMERAAQASKLPASLHSVLIDPRTSNVLFEYSIPAMQSAKETKQGLLYAGFHFVWAAQGASNDLPSFTLRGYAPAPGQEAAPTPRHVGADAIGAVSLAMVADLTSAQAQGARAATDYQTVLRYLNEITWRSDLTGAPL